MRARCLVHLVLPAVLAFPLDAHAFDPLLDDLPDEPIETETQPTATIESLIDEAVVTATKKKQRSVLAPAVISVINSQKLRRGGYKTVAEALNTIGGLAVNTDHAFYNVGVRGIAGGLRGGTRIIKLLINGQPVEFRPDALKFLGPELIPIEAIDRLEVIRGPASALYGRDAFLGVVNIITKAPAERAAGSYALRGQAGSLGSGVSAGGEFLAMDKFGDFAFTVAGHYARQDRSGLKLPEDSVSFSDYRDNSLSQNDIARPISLFASLSYALGSAGTLKLQGGLMNLDSAGEFVDYGPLSHRTRVNLFTYFSRLSHAVNVGRFSLNTFFDFGGTGVGPNHVIQPMIFGSPTSQQVEWRLKQQAIDTGLEGGVEFFTNSSLMAGVEYSRDSEDTRQNIFVSPELNAELPGRDLGNQLFSNVGTYAQLLFGEISWMQLSGNIRYDHHNLFGGNVNYRGVAVLPVSRSLTVKLLSGSSYRAPTPEQLYATPVKPGDVVGSLASATPSDLEPQTAINHELAFVYMPLANMKLELQGYYTAVSKRIEYLLVDGNLQPSNSADSETLGGEFSATVIWPRLFRRVNLYVDASIAYEDTRIRVDDAQARLITERQRRLLEIAELFPPWMAKWSLDVEVPKYHFNFHVRMDVFARRLESQLNQAQGRPFTDSPLRRLPVSAPLHVVLSSVDLNLWGKRETLVQVAFNDILNSSSPEPGFNGINIPALGRSFMVTLRQEL